MTGFDDELIPGRDNSLGRAKTGRARKNAKASKERVHVVLSLQDGCVAAPVTELFKQQLLVSRPLCGVVNGLNNISDVAGVARGPCYGPVGRQFVQKTHE